MTFKETVRADIRKTFMNVDEFGEVRTVNGRKMAVITDKNELMERSKESVKNHMDGLYTRSTLVYVKSEDFGALPKIGSPVALDGRAYRVTDAANEDGIYSIHLEANRS